jgi:hypothetical protein
MFRKYALKHTVQLTKPFIQWQLCFGSDLSICSTHVTQLEHYEANYIEQILQAISLLATRRLPSVVPRIEHVNQRTAKFQQCINNSQGSLLRCPILYCTTKFVVKDEELIHELWIERRRAGRRSLFLASTRRPACIIATWNIIRRGEHVARSPPLHTRCVCDDIGDGSYDFLALPPKFVDIR